MFTTQLSCNGVSRPHHNAAISWSETAAARVGATKPWHPQPLGVQCHHLRTNTSVWGGEQPRIGNQKAVVLRKPGRVFFCYGQWSTVVLVRSKFVTDVAAGFRWLPSPTPSVVLGDKFLYGLVSVVMKAPFQLPPVLFPATFTLTSTGYMYDAA